MGRKHFLSIACLCLTFLSGTGRAQGLTAIIEPDIRVFTVVAALNVAGFDIEFASQYHPVRQQVRDALTDVDSDLASRLRQFYIEHKGEGSDEDAFAEYISLALNLTDPPAFDFAFSDDLLPPDARALREVLPLLREFYESADIFQLWSMLAPEYERVLNRMVPPIRNTILQTDVYLREPLSGSRGRQLVIFVEVAAPVNSVNVRNYSDNLYLVIGDSTTSPVADVRHAYLHLLLDPIVARSRAVLANETRLTSLIQGIQGVRDDYANDFEILVSESLIRAVEFRMAEASDDLEGRIAAAYRSGLLLVRYFYDQLERFESAEIGIREFFPEMLEGVDVEAEAARFESDFSSIPVEDTIARAAEVPPVVDPVGEILREAERAFNAGNGEGARAAFNRVLDEFDASNGTALYGLALLASREGDADLAREYFARTLESASAESSMKVWSHVYLGRIFDLLCERETALAQYRSALALGDDTEGAQSAAARGIEEPFGAACEF